MGAGIDPAGRAVARVGIAGEGAVAGDVFPGAHRAGGQRRHGRAGLEGGAGLVESLRDAVDERAVFEVVVIVALPEGGEVIGRIARHGEGLAGLDVDGDERAGGGDVGLVSGIGAHGHDAVIERPFRRLLQIEVDREAHVVAGDRLGGIGAARDRAGGVLRDDGFAVLPMEVLLKGELRALLTDLGVHGIALLAVDLVLLGRHGPDVAEDVRRERGVVHALVGRRDLKAAQAIFHQGGDQVHAGVRHEDVVRGVHDRADLERVADAGDDAHLLGGVVVVDLEAVAEAAHEFDRGGVLRELRVLQIAAQQHALQGGHVGIFKGRRHRDGEIVVILVTRVLDELHHAQNGRVRVLLRLEVGVVELQAVGARVRDEHAAVTVENVAAGGADALRRRDAVEALLVILIALDDLQFIDGHEEDHQQHCQNQRQHSDPPGADGFVHGKRSFQSIGTN